ncbi:MAG: ferritin-like domain-containing protein [Solirubrobacterales bacterium]
MTERTDQTDSPSRLSRRGFLAAGAVGAGAIVVAACSSDDKTTTASSSSSSSTAAGSSSSTSGGGGGDAQIAMFAAGLETLAVDTYKAGLADATAGKLGAVPPAVAEFATTAMAHHKAAAEALAKAGGGGTPTVPADVKATVDTAFGKVTDVGGLAMLALELEEIAAATYLAVLPKLESQGAIDLVGSIMPIERQHVAILNFALGTYPVPETFATTEKSVAPG